MRSETKTFRNTIWIEQQAVLLNYSFAKWFFQTHLVSKILNLQKIHNVDWGIDCIWCAAADAYDNSSSSSCSIIHVPMFHSVTKTFNWGTNFVKRGFHLLKGVGLRKNLPCWYPSNCSLNSWFYMSHKMEKSIIVKYF